MANVINHNISAFNTLRNLNKSNSSLSGSLQKLSSGFRINTGKDGPADLVISEQLRAQTVGLERAVRNTQEAQNVIGIAEGALNEMNEILKTMRGLALHAANNGITSPEQVAADQAEVDSAIQTIDRIANTTKYSDQFLLNGNKELVYDRTTAIKGTQQNALVNLGQTNIESIFKLTDYQCSIAFSGTASANASGDGVASLSNLATKAYFEIDTGATDAGDVNADGSLSAAQNFILTGEKGSRQFSFDVGATVGQIASAINNVADSTGVDASLIFASDQTVDTATAASATAAHVIGGDGLRAAGTAAVFNKTAAANGITGYTTALTGVMAGKNTDGQGRIWIKYTSDTTAELYKDASMSKESLVATAEHNTEIIAQNNSGLGAGVFTIAGGLSAGSAEYIALAGIEGANGMTHSGNSAAAPNAANTYDSARTLVSGVELGKNTDSEGKLYIKTVMSGASAGTVFAYKDAAMRAEDLVAQSDPDIALDDDRTILLNEIRSDSNSEGTGIGITLGIGAGANDGFVSTAGSEFVTTIQFSNLGVRVSSQEYGSDAYVKLQQQEGKVFQYYEQADSSNPTLVEGGTTSGTVQLNGQDATLSINGTQVKTDGLSVNVSGNDLQGSFNFNEGAVGSTTIAQVGYTDGSVFSRAALLTDTAITGNGGAYLVNAGHVTTEFLGNFRGGMQFQLGEGSGDQERTVYSIQSMAVANLGMTEFSGQFDDGKAIVETRTLSLSSILGGGLASLGRDPIKALEIIDNAINDVSNLRARLGATQKNLLQTNANSLNVAIENIMATESDIRDANMAKETTDFTKNQILVQAGTAMLAQANSLSQNVLSLLG